MRTLPFESIKRTILVKKEVDTSPKFGFWPEKRPIAEHINFGVINIDKPRGPTSHQVSAYVKDIMGMDKSGHSGTLDPNVTGSLVVALGKATKVAQYLLTAGKEYTGIMHLHSDIEEYTIHEACDNFVGKIMQKPPVKSAVKREVRQRSIYYFEVLEINGRDVLFKVGCEAGTYIRKLVHDLGQSIGVGAHMAELRRTKVGPFDESTMVSMQELIDAYWTYKNKKDEAPLRKAIQPMENAVQHIPRIWVFDTTVNTLCHGHMLYVPGISKLDSGINKEDLVAVMSLKGELVFVGRAKMSSDDIMKNEKGVAVTSERVFMEPGIYPKMEKV